MVKWEQEKIVIVCGKIDGNLQKRNRSWIERNHYIFF